MATTSIQKDEERIISGQSNNFLPLYSQHSFGNRLSKSTSILPPFSKLFFTGNTKQSINTTSMLSTKLSKREDDSFQVLHDEELCMFYIKLDQRGTTAAICYLPTSIKKVIEAYHIEIPLSYRHMGLGDKLVKECLNWAKESGTLVIPTCAFVKRHLEFNGVQMYTPVILDEFPQVS